MSLTVSESVSDKIMPYFEVNEGEDSAPKKFAKLAGGTVASAVITVAGIVEGMIYGLLALIAKAFTFFMPRRCPNIRTIDGHIQTLLERAVNAGIRVPTQRALYIAAEVFGASDATRNRMTKFAFNCIAAEEIANFAHAHINGSSKPTNGLFDPERASEESTPQEPAFQTARNRIQQSQT
jgi:hypothetical protein